MRHRAPKNRKNLVEKIMKAVGAASLIAVLFMASKVVAGVLMLA